MNALIAEDPAPLGHERDAVPRHPPGGPSGDVAAVGRDAARGGAKDACDGLEQRGLARAIAPDDRDDLTLPHLERDVVEDGDGAVRDGEARHGERVHGTAPR